MAQFPALPLFTDAYLADCGHLNDEEHGRYLLLLIAIWRAPGCRIPNDDTWLARHFRRSIDETEALFRPLIAEFCQTDGNWISQKRLRRERAYLEERSRKQSDRAKARWAHDNSASPGSTAPGIAGHGYTPTSTSTPTPTPTPTATGVLGRRRSLNGGRVSHD